MVMGDRLWEKGEIVILHSRLNLFVDFLAHRIELLFHLAVGKAQYLQAILAQDLAPLFVVSLPLFSIML